MPAQAAKEESPGFDCTGCPWARNTAGKSSDPADIKDECLSCGDLLAEVFRLPGCRRVYADG